MKPEDIEDIRQKAYQKYRKKYHIYVDEAIASTKIRIGEIPAQGRKGRTKKELLNDLYPSVKADVDANTPKTGLFSWLFLLTVQAIISWIIQRMLDKYYAN